MLIRPAALLLVSLAAQLSAADLSVKVTPSTIAMGTFYDGAKVRVSGTCEDRTSVVIVVRGGDARETFNVKGRVGPLWVNTGRVQISSAPSLFLAFSSQPVRDLLNAKAIEEYGLDLAALKGQLQIEPGTMDRDIIRTDFLNLKQEEKSYHSQSGAVEMAEPEANGTPYSAEFQWPKKAPPGAYEVRVYECRAGSVLAQTRTGLTVAEVGFPTFMSSLAKNHASIYGAVAVLVTMLAGFGMDLLASRTRRRRKGEPPPRVLPAAPPEPQLEHTSAGVGSGAKMAGPR